MKKKKNTLIYSGYEIEIKKNKVIIYDKKSKMTDEETVKVIEYLLEEGFIEGDEIAVDIILG